MTPPDLAARILAEIDHVERIAQRASPGPWTADVAFTGYWAVSTPDVGGGVVAASLGGGCEKQGNAAHIALHDPASALRRCAADRRIVERHEPRDAGVKSTWIICDYCSHCPDAVEWPCPDIVDLADGYGITVDGAA